MKKKVCLITPSHLASNPRLIKEAIALEGAGFLIHIVFTQNLSYLIEHDFNVLAEHSNWTYDVLNCSKSNKSNELRRYKNALVQKLANFTLRYIQTLLASKLALNRNYYWQKKKAVQSKSNLYIAHNLAALPVAFHAAKQAGTKCGFDAEDFHREEQASLSFQTKNTITIKIEDYYIPKMDYVTAASPLIAEKYSQLYKREIPVLLNVFPRTAKSAVKKNNNPLKLFWFSQTIGPNRGLENIMNALKSSNLDFEFHLLGNVSSDYQNQILSILPKEKQTLIYFYAPVTPNLIFELCTHFDIGIASEPGFSTNNNIALSNKIFTYLQTGLAVLASDTLAQKEFMLSYPEIGFTYIKDDVNSLTECLNRYHLDRDLLRMHQQQAYDLGQHTLNWEIEQKKIVDIVSNLITP